MLIELLPMGECQSLHNLILCCEDFDVKHEVVILIYLKNLFRQKYSYMVNVP